MDSMGTLTMKLGNSPTAATGCLFPDTGPVTVEEKSGRIQQIRPVDWKGFEIFCEEENKYVFVWDVVRIHFESLREFI